MLESIPSPQTVEPTPTTTGHLETLPAPPALHESLELLSARVPVSLRQTLADFTVASGSRNGKRVSQKALPEQEAVLVWLARSAENPEDLDRLSRAIDAYRAHRYAAEARPSRPPGARRSYHRRRLGLA